MLTTSSWRYAKTQPRRPPRSCTPSTPYADGLAAYGVAFEAWRDVQSALIDARRAVAQARQQDGEETRS
jgi:hypothetical protein